MILPDHLKFEMKFCPTDKMIADFMTKPLQGSKFKKFRKGGYTGEKQFGLRKKAFIIFFLL